MSAPQQGEKMGFDRRTAPAKQAQPPAAEQKKEYPDDLGTLWKNQGKNGPYYSGEINGVRVVGFPKTVNKKDGTTAEVINLQKSKPRPEQ